MSLPIILRRLAQAEFDEAADWYEQRRAGHGTVFTVAVRQTLAAIAADPIANPEVYHDVREKMVVGFPYVVFYQVTSTQITVLAVFHTHRDPAVWQARV